MDILLRKKVVDEQQQSQLTDYELQAESIRMGSAPDSELQLLGPNIKGVHARLKVSDDCFELIGEKSSLFIHNGEAVKRAAINVGDEIIIDQHQLVISEPPPGFDLAIIWQPAAVGGGLLANAYKTKLAQTELRTRPIAWTAFIVILLVAGLLPLVDYTVRSLQLESNNKQPITRYVADSFWSSGPLHSAHNVAIGERCESCHEQAFVPVQDQACTHCHGGTTTHTALDNQHAALFADQACQNCHKEHNEPQQLTNRNDALCQSCHANLTPVATGFSAKNHPEFRVSLLQPSVSKQLGSLSTEWQLNKIAIADMAHTQENSHLKFSHQVHLDATKVRDQLNDTQLQCSNCHSLSADREHFQPITMEQQCISCHELSFDPNQPKKQLPHGDIANIYPTLEAHFLALAFDDNSQTTFERRRLPAKIDAASDCTGDVVCAKQKATAENDRQFSQSGCVTCHYIEKIDGVDAQSRWQLLPVRLTSDWYPAAQFDHRSHLTQSGETENLLCGSCHEAQSSTTSTDILIPAMANCSQCHSDNKQGNKVPMQCVSCHQYHPKSLLNSTRRSVGNQVPTPITAFMAETAEPGARP